MRLLEKLLRLLASKAAPQMPDGSGIAPRKLLAIKLSGLGDAVMVRSLIEHLRDHDSRLEIGVLGGPSTVEALSCASDFHVHGYYTGKNPLISVAKLWFEIRREEYDTLVDFEPYSLLTAAFGRATGIRCRIGFAGLDGSRRASFFTHPVPIDDEVRFWDNFVRLTRVVAPSLGNHPMTRSLPIAKSVEEWIDGWLREHLQSFEERNLVALHLGAATRMAYRCWPVESFIQLANALKEELSRLTIVLTGTASETEVTNKFQMNYSGNCVNATCLGGLERTAALLRRCQLLISNDTGVMHLGAALKVPTLGLFGPSNPVHWAPQGLRASYLYATKVSCSPCIDVYHRKAPADCFNPDYQRCMNDISPSAVSKAALRILSGVVH